MSRTALGTTRPQNFDKGCGKFPPQNIHFYHFDKLQYPEASTVNTLLL